MLCINLLTRWALSTTLPSWRGAYLAPLYRQAKAIAWDYLMYYTQVVPGVKYYQQELRADFPNGSRIMLLGADNPDSLRGIYLDAVVLDEVAQMRTNLWSEIIRPTLADRKGRAIFIGTPKGRNHFYDLYNRAGNLEGWSSRMLRASETNILDPQELEAIKRELTEEEYNQEFECSFEGSIMGAYYASPMANALTEGRLASVPYDPIMEVHTAWDLGVDDYTVIWFVQISPGGEIRLIDYYEMNGEGLPHYVKYLREKDYVYGRHLAPHDIKVREFSTGRSRLEIAEGLGLSFDVIPAQSVSDGIEAVRSILPRCWFDAKKCDPGIEALRQYRKEYSEKLNTFRNQPLHDWASHGADAFRTLANGLERIMPVPSLKVDLLNQFQSKTDAWMM
uniref:Putative terminase n=1 Tax=viral metagenome TaxID=1070528 RepID=A0A6M3KGI3_9ZZZZ